MTLYVPDDAATQTMPGEAPPAEQKRVEEIELLVQEANTQRTARMPNGATREDVWEQNGKRYVGDQWDQMSNAIFNEGSAAPRDLSTAVQRFTINRTQNSIIAQRALAFERPETVRFMGVETDEGGVVFIKPRIGQGLVRDIEAGQLNPQELGLDGFEPEQLAGLAPIPEEEAEFLLATGLLRDSDLFHITDRSVARDVQTVWDCLYQRAKGPYYVATNELYCSIFGSHPMLFQWDSKTNRFKFSNPHILNVWVDPTAENIEEAEYVILDTVISAVRAKSLWPKLSAAITEAQESGSMDSRGLRYGSCNSFEFRREMVIVRTAWLRYREVDMTLTEALDSGSVVQEPNDPLSFRRADTGGATKPGASNWPKTAGIMQVQVLPQINREISSRRCPYWDIPIGWNKNIPVPYSIYGQGEPERVEDVQQAINRLFTILHRHARYYQAPMEFWPEPLWQDLKAKGYSPYSKPGRIVPVRLDIYQLMVQLGGSQGFGVVNTIPPIPSFYVDLLRLLLEEHDRLSGFVDVLQGSPPGADTSGRAIEALQTAARGPIGLKTTYTEWMLERIAYLGLDAIRKWLPETEWQKILSRYPLPVLRYIRSRVDLAEFDIKVEIVSGKGVNRALDEERAARLYMDGAPQRLVSRERAMEMADIENRDAEQRKIDEENASGFGVAPVTAPQDSPPV